jgi:hypothetical protein
MKTNDKLILFLDNQFMRAPGILVVVPFTLLLFAIYLLVAETNELQSLIIASSMCAAIVLLVAIEYTNVTVCFTYRYRKYLLQFIDIQMTKYPKGWWIPTDSDTFNSKKQLPKKYSRRILVMYICITVIIVASVLMVETFIGDLLNVQWPDGVNPALMTYSIGVFYLSAALYWKCHYRKICQIRFERLLSSDKTELVDNTRSFGSTKTDIDQKERRG